MVEEKLKRKIILALIIVIVIILLIFIIRPGIIGYTIYRGKRIKLFCRRLWKGYTGLENKTFGF